jgi:hypothetical protein
VVRWNRSADSSVPIDVGIAACAEAARTRVHATAPTAANPRAMPFLLNPVRRAERLGCGAARLRSGYSARRTSAAVLWWKPAGYSVRLNSQIAIPSIPSPSAMITITSSTTGTCQPHQVIPGSSTRRAAGEIVRWLNTSRRIGSTA